jgi:uncharacterized LabA/DUF88 family protein
MHLAKAERTILMIDGKDLSAAQRALDFVVDFKRLLAYFRAETHLIRAMYYTTLVVQDPQPLKPLVDWLEYNGYYLVTKNVYESFDAEGRRHVRGDTRVELAVDAMDALETVDHFIIIAGDGSFRRLVAALQRRGKRVTVVSSIETSPPLVADDLRRQADQFVDLVDLEPMIARESSGETYHAGDARDAEAEDDLPMPARGPEAEGDDAPPAPPATRAVVVERRSSLRRPKR